DEGGATLGVRVAERAGGRDELAPEHVLQAVGARAVGHPDPQQRPQHAVPLPQLEEVAHQHDADGVRVDARGVGEVELDVDDGREQPLLRAEVPHDHRRVDPGVVRDGPHRRALVAVGREAVPRGLEDRGPGRVRPSPGCRGLCSGCHANKCRPTTVDFLRAGALPLSTRVGQRALTASTRSGRYDMTTTTDSTADTPADTDVVVVGAGPTGLLLAGDLAAAGVRVTVLEKRPAGLSNLTRAFAVHARSLEVLDARGLVDDLLPRGRRIQGLRLFQRLTVTLADLPS